MAANARRQDRSTLKLDLAIAPAGMQPIEIGDAIDAEQNRLAIDHKGRLPIAQRGLNDQRIAFRSLRGTITAVHRV